MGYVQLLFSTAVAEFLEEMHVWNLHFIFMHTAATLIQSDI